jgi:molecular chaperone DnaK (HSP70)
MPMISSTIQRLAGSKLALLQLPDDAVVKGAALQAGYRMQRPGDPQGGMVVKNTSFQSLGVAGFNGEEWVNITVIPRGTTLPVTAKRTFKTHTAGQESIGVQLLEGENESPSDCIEIGNCAIDGLSPDLPENTPVQVDLQYDIDGRVSVFAQLPDQTKRTRQSVTREHELSASDLHRLREWVETVMLCSSIT